MRGKDYKDIDYNALLERYKNGTKDEQAEILELVVEANENLIKSLMNRRFPTYVASNGEDMMQEAKIAIMSHFPNFDPSKGKFSTYMSYYILEAFKWYVCTLHQVSPHYLDQAKKYRHAVTALAKRGIENPTLDVIAEEMNCGLDAALKAQRFANYMNCASIEGDEREKTLSGYDMDPETHCEEQELKETLVNAIRKLNPEKQLVINTMYFSGNKPLSIKETAERLHTDVITVRRDYNSALRELGNNPMLKAIIGVVPNRELDEAADDIIIEFVMPKAAVERNLSIAIDLDFDDNGEELMI